MLSARRRLAKLAKKAKAQKERAKLAAAEAERETQRDAEAWSEIALGEIVVGNDIIRVHPRLLEWVAEYKRAEAAGDTEQLEALDARFTDLVEEITATTTKAFARLGSTTLNWRLLRRLLRAA
jgi:hypothetical protein